MPSVRILQLTDLHVFADPLHRLKDIPTFELLQDVVAEIRASGQTFDHVVITGDHTHDELPETYRALRLLLEPWIDRLWQVPGNHDDRAVMRSVFGDRIGGQADERIKFEFSADRWLCLGLDTQVPGTVPGLIEADQIDWVRRRIQENNPDRVMLFMHHPPVDLNSVWMDRIGLAGKELLQDLLRSEERIRLVCCGHVHHESTHRIGQAEIVTTPSTAIQFSPHGEVATFVTAPPGWRIIELQGDTYQTTVGRLAEARYAPQD